MRPKQLTAAAFASGALVGWSVAAFVSTGPDLTPDWGDVGGWVGGMATATAVGVAAAQLMSQRRSEARAQSDLHRSLAMSVTVADLAVVDEPPGRLLSAIVENGGTLPVFEAQVDLYADNDVKNVRIGTIGVGARKAIKAPVARWIDTTEVTWKLRFRDSFGSVWESDHGTVARLEGGRGGTEL